MRGYIYIAKVRESIRIGEYVYKVGKTGDIFRRIKQYPKGTVLLYTIYTEDITESENKILILLRDFVRKDLGREYIELDLEKIKKIIDEAVKITDAEKKADETININNIDAMIVDEESEDEYEFDEMIVDDENKDESIEYPTDLIDKPIRVIKMKRKDELIEIRQNIGEFYKEKILKDKNKEYKLYEIHNEYNNWNNHKYNITSNILNRILKDYGGTVIVKRFDNEVTKIITFEKMYEKIEEKDTTSGVIKEWILKNYELTNSNNDRIKSKELLDIFKNDTGKKITATKFKQELESIGIEYCRSNGKTEYRGIKELI